MMALGCLFALNHAGVQAPRDIAIAGFDDIPLARYVHPSLTTMRVDIAELGARALRTLLDSMASQAGPGDGTSQMEPLVPKLMVRDSSVAGAGGKQARVSAAVDA
jgi:LacI family transcriptional regulator